MTSFKDEYTIDEDDVSLASKDSSVDSTTDPSGSEEPERDEKKEIYRISAKDTFRVQLTRVLVTLVLLLTACAVTLTTYKLLKDEETNSFETAFDRFSLTLAEAAIDNQKNIRDTMRGLAATVAGQARASNQSWPAVKVDLFELYAHNSLTQAHVEFISMVPRVHAHQYGQYMGFINSNHLGMTESGHLIRWGDLTRLLNDTERYAPFISASGPQGFGPDQEREDYWPSQMYSPPSRSYGMNHNIGSLPTVAPAIEAMKHLHYETIFTAVSGRDKTSDLILTPEVHATFHSQFKDSNTKNPHGYAIHPVHEDPTDPLHSEIVGMITAGMAFDASLLNLLPDGVEGIHCLITSGMSQSFTYEVVGGDVYFLGDEDMHQPQYQKYEVEVDLSLHTHPEFKSTPGHSQYKMYIYPSDRFRESYNSGTPEIFAAAVAITFVLVACVFFVYDLFVFKRNENLVAKAASSNAIVSSLFPEHMRAALMKQKEEDQMAKDNASKQPKSLKASLEDGSYHGFQAGHALSQKPMADLYLETTVLFADIQGFTAWSSVREPSQVFQLLETIFHAFDVCARKKKVFKVETVGDCYVAVAGLPEPRVDHAIQICRFARDILTRFLRLSKQLEVSLGPDTGSLELRIGIHSGQVTAGVLRGDRARFQLFGDTMNVCQRVESTGKGGRIHASREAAESLHKLGKEAWLEKRSNSVSAKGVGLMETYWVSPAGERAASITSRASLDDALVTASRNGRTSSVVAPIKDVDARMNRLINWNCEMLLDLMQQIVARRSAGRQASKRNIHSKLSLPSGTGTSHPLDEVAEIISLPAFDAAAARKQQDPATVKIPEEVVKQLHELVSSIARLYNDNPFHNFDHASHVVQSVIKLLSRIVVPSHLDGDADHASLHDHTYGITSDPLTFFACAFAALIHDVDHVGVSNAQLVKEGVEIATKYRTSVAEQNSLDLSWDLLMQPRFDTFRSFLFSTSTELQRFRQLVVNSVMSTDIVDKDLKALRNSRWEKAFQTGNAEGAGNRFKEENVTANVNRKATIVIEHIIQASDISHTMQHWHVYRKWNQNLFEELYVAYLNGRMEKDPATFWYKGEFGFFDFYIIPLTRKLKECGVFGVSSDEFLNYATKNREMWELHGEEAVAEMIEEAHRKYGVKNDQLKIDVVPEKAPCHATVSRKADGFTEEVDV